ncbi:methyltransferase family protein [Novosphingobium sp. PhB55]|nr:methyltransferase family protein [Novosphingobium sp. PhB55]
MIGVRQMDDRTHGYDVSVGYTYGYCREMAPAWMDLAAGAGETSAAGGGRFLELGCGQGFGLCLLAAANPGRAFVGIDLMAEHVDHANGIAASAGLANVQFVQGDFVELARSWPEALGRFDHVALHGVYSWVTAPVRQALLQCIGQASAPGALVYIGYNAQPGWLATMPFRHMARLIHEEGAAPVAEVLDRSISLFEQLRGGGAATFQLLPGLGARLDSLRKRDIAQLAHEYLHEGWEPMWHSQVAREVAGAGLAFAGSATLPEALLPAFLPSALRDTILAQGDPLLRQDVQDFVINQFYRRDVYRRGEAPATPTPTLTPTPGERAAQTRFLLLDAPAPGATLSVRTPFGELALQPPAYAGIVEALAERSLTLAELAVLPKAGGKDLTEVLQLVLMLLHAGTLGIEAPRTDHAPAQRLNAAIAREAVRGMPYDHLAAPAIGGAVPVDFADLMLIDAWLALGGLADETALSERLVLSLAGSGRTLQRGGSPLEGVQERREARSRARTFLDRDLPRWRRLGALA